MNFSEIQLSSIPWSKLKTASGTAEHVPDALKGLVSPDESIREKSYWQLDNKVVRQSDLFESAYFVLPFVLTMLRERVPHGRDIIYELVFEIANGFAPTSVLVKSFDGVDMPLKEACLQEILKYVDVFRQDVNDPSPGIRRDASDLLELIENNPT